jgi:SAM-dependent methyltransferase
MSNDLAQAWGAHADLYDRLFAPMTGFIARGLFALVAPRLPARAHVLDIACGTGAFTLPAVEHLLRERAATGATGRVVATDFAAGMVEVAARHARAAGADDEVLTAQVANGEALPFADGSFDAVGSSFGIFLFGDRRAGWREAARVLRPGGTFATAVWQGAATNPMLRAQMGPVAQALPARLAGPPPPGGWMEIAEAPALVAEVTAAAPLVDAHCSTFHASVVLPDSAQAWGAMRTNPVMGGLLRQCSGDELAAIEANVLRTFDGLAGGPGRPIVLESVCNLLVATRA